MRGGVSAVAFVLGWGEMASSSCDADGLILIFQAAADVRRFRPPLLVRKTAGFLAGQGAAAQCRSTLCSVSVSDSTDDIVPLFDLVVGRCGFGVGVLIFF